MFIGHIRLSETFDESAHGLLRLVFSLAQRHVQQQAIVSCPQLAARLERENISVRQCAASPMDAYCAFVACDLAHAHDALAAKTALLLKLTTAQPYVLTYRETTRCKGDPVLRSAYRRADTIFASSQASADAARKICKTVPTHIAREDRRCDALSARNGARSAAAEHLSIYRRVLDRGVPDILL